MAAAQPASRPAAEGASWIDFSTRDNPFGTPDSFAKALARAIDEGALSYKPDRSAQALRSALSRTLMLPEDSFLVGATVSDMIGAVAQTFEQGSVGVMVPCPAEYILVPSNAGHKVERISAGSTYITPSAEAVASAGVEVNAAILANPGFPTSRLLPEQVLMSYLSACDWVVVDERSIELTLNGKSYAPLVEQYRNLFVIQSFSEQYALPGAPVSYCMAHPDTIAETRRFYDDSSISLFPEALAEASVSEHPKLDGTRGFLYSEIPWMQTMLSLVPGIEIFPAEANFVMCAYRNDENLKLPVKDTATLVQLLHDAGCLVLALDDMPGLAGEGCFCVSVRTRQENERLISTLRSILA